MKKLFALLAVVGLLAVGAAPATASSAAEPELQVVKVGYNAAGPDKTTNAWQEYIDVKNVSGDVLNIKNWSVQDAWAHSKNGNSPEASDCNTAIFTKASLPWLDTNAADIPGDDDGLWLPEGHYIRVYTGGAADNSDNGWHSMAINKPSCGYNGHYLNNSGDTIYVKRANGTLVLKFTYDFRDGYYING